jgi:hypothetical protein
MEKVGFIDSSGLGVLVSALRRARERDGVVRIVCTRDNILKIFRITGLDKVFPIYAEMARLGGSSKRPRPGGRHRRDEVRTQHVTGRRVTRRWGCVRNQRLRAAHNQSCSC